MMHLGKSRLKASWKKPLSAAVSVVLALTALALAPLPSAANTPISGKVTGLININGDVGLETVNIDEAQVQVSWVIASEEYSSNAWTDNLGNFTVNDVPDQITQVSVSVQLRNQGLSTDVDMIIPQNPQDFLSGIRNQSLTIANRSFFNIQLTAASRGSATISGVVRDTSGNPLEGIQVYTEVEPTFTGDHSNGNPLKYVVADITDVNGAYTLEDVLDDKFYSLNYLGVGDQLGKFYPGNVQTKLRVAATSRNRDLILTPVPTGDGSIIGTVSSGGTGLAGYVVKAQLIGSSHTYAPSAQEITDSNGEYSLSNLPAGKYEIEVFHPGAGNVHDGIYDYWPVSDFVYPGEIYSQIIGTELPVVRNISLELRPAASSSLNGRLIDADDVSFGLDSAEVKLQGTEFGMESYSTTTNSMGNWAITEVRPGRYSVNFRPEEDHFISDPVFLEVLPNQTIALGNQSVQLVKPGTGKLMVSVRSESSRAPVSGATVSLRNPHSTIYEFGEGVTDSKGQITFDNLPIGIYSVSVSAFDFTSQGSATVQMINTARTIGVLLPEPWQMTGQVTGRLIHLVDGEPEPVSNTTVSAIYETSYGRYGLAGGGYGPSDITDDEGRFVVDDVLLGFPLELMTQNSDAAPIQFATYREVFGPLSSLENTKDFGDIYLVEGYDIQGTFVSSSTVEGHELQMSVIDLENGVSLLTTGIDADGSFELRNIPPVDAVLFVRDLRNQSDGTGFAGGYITEVTTGTFGVQGSSTDAFVFAAEDIEDQELDSIGIEYGGSISGQANLIVDGQIQILHNRAFAVVAHRLEAGGYEDAFMRYPTWAYGWEGGEFTISGLPAGTYKVEIADINSFYSSWSKFVGPGGASVDSLDQARTFVVLNSNSDFTGANAVLDIPKPSSVLNAFNLDSLDAELQFAYRDQVTIDPDSTGSLLEVNVGDQYVGEWLFVEILEDNQALTPLSIAQAERLSAQSTEIDIAPRALIPEGDWYQVKSDGKITIGGNFSSPANFRVIVQEAGEFLVGWTSGGIQSNGTLTFESGDVSTNPVIAPSIKGTVRVGRTLTATRGSWEPLDGAAYKYSWFACKAKIPEVRPTKSTGCVKIPGAVRRKYEISKGYRGAFLMVRITAVSGELRNRVFTPSTRKVRAKSAG